MRKNEQRGFNSKNKSVNSKGASTLKGYCQVLDFDTEDKHGMLHTQRQEQVLLFAGDRFLFGVGRWMGGYCFILYKNNLPH